MNEAAPKKSPSIGRGIWQSFMLFTVVIIALLWVMQTLFMSSSYYTTMKERQILKATRQVEASFAGKDVSGTVPDDVLNTVSQVATANNLSIVLSHTDGLMLFNFDNHGASNVLFAPEFRKLIAGYLKMSQEGTLGEDVTTVQNPISGKQTLLVVKSVALSEDHAGVLFLNGTIEPIWATMDILQNQLVIITIVLLVLSALIAIILSRRISRPITRINESAKKLAKGDYTPNFEGGSYQEVGDLAETLNGAAVELGRVESLRRELVANVSHDLRTPLTMIKAYAEMIRDITGDNPEKRNAQLGIIVDEADRLGRLVSDLVAISREETSGDDLDLEPFDIVPCLSQLNERLELSYPDYRFTVEADESCVVSGDLDRINQVLYNLASNAVSYTGEDKTVVVRQTVRGDFARIDVLDTGPGIPANEVDLIWQRYYRSSFHKTAKAGTGLGLSIVKEVMDAHGADFGVTNRPGGGSCFWFELPIADEIDPDDYEGN